MRHFSFKYYFNLRKQKFGLLLTAEEYCNGDRGAHWSLNIFPSLSLPVLAKQ